MASPEKLFNDINIGDHVKGYKDGVKFSGIVTDMEDDRLPRGQGAKGYKWTIKLDEPISLYGAERKTIRVYLNATGGNDSEIQKNPGTLAGGFIPCKAIRIINGRLEIKK